MILATFNFRYEPSFGKYSSTDNEFNILLCLEQVHRHFEPDKDAIIKAKGFEIVLSTEPDPGYSVEIDFVRARSGWDIFMWETDLHFTFEYSAEFILDNIAKKHKPPFYATLYYTEYNYVSE